MLKIRTITNNFPPLEQSFGNLTTRTLLTSPQPQIPWETQTPIASLVLFVVAHLSATDAEMQDKLSKGLCFRCDENFGPGHVCANKQFNVSIMDGDMGGEDKPEAL